MAMLVRKPAGVFLLIGLTALIIAAGVMRGSFTSRSAVDLPEVGIYEQERNDGSYYTIVDTDGRMLDKTARVIYPGDEFIAEDNRRYRINRVEGDTAWAEMIGLERISWEAPSLPASTLIAEGETAGTRNLVAVYHTHSDESYVPSDGAQSIPAGGGIYKVGEVMVEKLRSLGVNVEYDKRPHEPHDSEAYRRSRRTAAKLTQRAPAAIIDVHRDGVPDASFYNEQVAGGAVTNVRFVVGRENANMQANLDFAKRLKAYLDQEYPGLVKGIHIGRGNYNQDLSPRSVLVEVGTYTSDRARAQRGAGLFAEAVPAVLGIGTAASRQGPGPVETQAPPSTAGDWWAVFWVIIALVAGGFLFLVISTGSWEAAVEALRKIPDRLTRRNRR